jgi:hypothetical protein
MAIAVPNADIPQGNPAAMIAYIPTTLMHVTYNASTPVKLRVILHVRPWLADMPAVTCN